MSDQLSPPTAAGGVPAPPQPERPFDLRGRVALVTGAARPLGGAIALALAEAGADVALAGLTGSADEHFQVNSAANQVWSLGRRNLALQVDLTDPVAVEAAVQRVEDEWHRLDLLVNAQDLLFAMPFGETNLEEWNATLAANLTSVALTCQAAGRVMLRAGYGRIINVASVAGDRGVMNMAAYAAAKSGVLALTRALATEWARTGVTVNTVQVGWYEDQAGIGDDPEHRKTLTKILPARALVTNDEVTGAVVMLAADSGYFTGQVVVVDGAATARI